MTITGNAWVFGDNINTDLLAPGHAMRLVPEEMAKHALEAVNPNFASQVRPGDILVAGENFGCGSAREQAAISLSTLGVGAVVAKSFARIFYRNAINIGLPVVTFSEALMIQPGDLVEIDLADGQLSIHGHDRPFRISEFNDHILTILANGGLMRLLERKFAQGDAK